MIIALCPARFGEFMIHTAIFGICRIDHDSGTQLVSMTPKGVRPSRIMNAANNNSVASRFLARKARYEADATKNARSAYIVDCSGLMT